jgi:tetratricopeptide (TPR) repeat protein
LAEGYIAATALGPMPVKGIANPVRVYNVTGAAARTRFQAATERGLTRFVGRDIEMDQLLRARQVADSGRGQVVAIVGEAGVGKSRLVHEFLHSQATGDWLILESNSASFGRTTPYLPIIELLRRYFRITVNDTAQSIRAKVSGKILTSDPALHDSISPLLHLLDVIDKQDPFLSLDPAQHRQHTYQAVISLLLREARIQPVVAIIEDLHWSDNLTLGLLNELLVAIENARLLLIVNYRPEYQDQWANLPNYHQLRLSPLANESLAELLLALLGSDHSLPVLKGFLVERTGGNPFFVEEIARALVDTGVLEGTTGSYCLTKPFPSIEVPPTVRAVLAARIDALAGDEKRLLEAAAVIGHDISFMLLHAICELSEDRLRSLLNNLQAADFLYAKRIFPDLQYTFKHSLTQDVAYSGILHERRREVHARVLVAIEQLYEDRVAEHVERLAYHAMRGEEREKAVHYLSQAGGRAASRSALSDARAWFEQAVDVVEALPKSRTALVQAFEIRLELRRVLRQLGEGRQMLERLREAEVLAERLNDDHRRGQVYALMTTVHSTLDELDEALVTGTRALGIAEHLGDLRLRIVATSHLEQVYYYRGEYGRVVDIANKTLATLRTDAKQDFFGMAALPAVFGRAYPIMSLAELGRFDEGARHAAKAIRIAKPTQHAHTVGWADFAASMLHLIKGDWAKAYARVEHWIAMVRTGNVAVLLPWAVVASAWALAQLGRTTEALSRVREGEQLLERQAAKGNVGFGGWSYGAMGRACLLLGRLDDAERLGDCSIQSTRRQPGFKAHALRLLGDIAMHPGRFDAESAVAHYQEALTLAEQLGNRPLVAHCHLGLGNVYRRTGKPEQAHDNLSNAVAMYRDMDMGFWLTLQGLT